MSRHKRALAIVYALIIAAHLAIGLGFGYFYRAFIIRGFQDVNEKVQDVTGTHVLTLPRGYSYILKIWGDAAPQDLFINDKEVIHSFFRQRQKLKELHYFIPEGLITEAPTRIRIEPAFHFSLRLRNSIASSEWGSIILRSSRSRPTASSAPLVLFAGFAVTIVLSWWALRRRISRLKESDIAATYFWSSCLTLFVFWLLKSIGDFFNVLFVFHPSSWALCIFFTFGLVYAVRGLVRRLTQLKREDVLTPPGGYPLSGVREIDAALYYFELLYETFRKTSSRKFVFAAAALLVLTCAALLFDLLLWANLLSIIVYACLLMATIRKFNEVCRS